MFIRASTRVSIWRSAALALNAARFSSHFRLTFWAFTDDHALIPCFSHSARMLMSVETYSRSSAS